MSAGAVSAPGWFGKLSVVGDFAHRRLAPEVVRQLDGWLAAWVGESRRTLGEAWLDAYLTAPLLRFAWSPGVVGPHWWFGVLMPSCDSAGRYFPLLVAQPHAAPPDDAAAFERLGRWLDRVADAATCTLADAASIDAFEAALAVVDEANAAPGIPQDWAAGLAATRWWVRSGDRIDGTVTRVAGLPDATTITRLMLG